MLTTISHAHGLGYLSALTREEDGRIGRNFWNFLRRFRDPHADPDPEERESWTDRQTKYLYQNWAALQRLLRFLVDEIDRDARGGRE